MTTEPARLSLVHKHSVRVPGVLSEEVKKGLVILDEHEADALEVLGRRLIDLGAIGSGSLLERIVSRWQQGPKVGINEQF